MSWKTPHCLFSERKEHGNVTAWSYLIPSTKRPALGHSLTFPTVSAAWATQATGSLSKTQTVISNTGQAPVWAGPWQQCLKKHCFGVGHSPSSLPQQEKLHTRGGNPATNHLFYHHASTFNYFPTDKRQWHVFTFSVFIFINQFHQ